VGKRELFNSHHASSGANVRKPHKRHVAWFLAVLLLVVLASSAMASADPSPESQEATPGDKSASVLEAIEIGTPASSFESETDAGAASGMDLGNLGRPEAMQVMEGVFGSVLTPEMPAVSELESAEFLAPNVAVLPGEEGESGRAGGLLESSVPLVSSLSSGKSEPVDLELQRTGEAIEPVNPVVAVSIPPKLGEGIELPESEIGLHLVGAPASRVVSQAQGLGAFYPEVAEDSDLLVTPTPTGFETDIQLRGPAAPTSQTYALDLPEGASLRRSTDGGVEVVNGDELLLQVQPPTAIDATGASVPAQLTFSGDTITVSVSVSAEDTYPILVDPLYEGWWWKALHTTEGIYHYPGESPFKHGELENFWSTARGGGWSPEDVMAPNTWTELSNNEDATHGAGADGLFVRGPEGSGTVQPGDRGWWVYSVPNYWTDQAQGTTPESYIEQLNLWELKWSTYSPYESAYWSPYLLMGIARPNYSWESVIDQPSKQGYGLNDPSHIYEFKAQDPEAKLGIIGMGYGESVPPYQNAANVFVGVSTVALNEPSTSVPHVGTLGGPSQWMNETALPLHFSFGDHGLGLYAIRATPEQYVGSPQPTWETGYGCTDQPNSPCPEVWASTESAAPPIRYEPGKMPTGIDRLSIVAFDPLLHSSAAAHAEVKIDHTAPSVSLSGSATEVATLGPKRPTYTLNVAATDGTVAAPQSGISEATIEFDGKVVQSAAPHCATENCSASLSWTLQSKETTAGSHTLRVVAKDAVGNVTTKTLNIVIEPTTPEIILGGSMTEEASLGTSRPGYKLTTKAVGTGGTAKSGSVSSEVLVDGKEVASASQSCSTERCEKSFEYQLLASTYHHEGTHVVTVKATDLLGNTTTRTLEISLSPDSSSPEVTVSGPLVSAPEGWVQQAEYAFSATAHDSGAGVTSLAFKIDGTVVASSAGSCAEGGCERVLSKSVEMSKFSGGAHEAEVIATDGAGNTRTKHWTINVDPEGHISSEELEDTLEAVESTSEAEPLSSNHERMAASGEPESAFPVLHEAVTHLVTSGTPDITEIEKSGGFSVGLPEDTMNVEPLHVAGSALPAIAVEESVAMAANTATNADTLVRPVYNGIMAFQSIRDASAPSSYSWEVELWPGQTLKQVDPETAEVFLKDGTEAFLISAELAHDAIGTEVPTTLSVEGNVITLTVDDQSGNYVFPVVSGTGWYGGITTEYPTPPLDELQIREREEQREREEEEARKKEEEVASEGGGEENQENGYLERNRISAPVPVSVNSEEGNEATGSSAGRHAPYEVKFEYELCAGSFIISGCGEWKLIHWGFFRFNGVNAWWAPSGPHPHCEHPAHAAGVTLEFCNWTGSNFQPYGNGRHVSSQMLDTVYPLGSPVGVPEPITEYMYGSGHAEGHKTSNLCNPLSECN
jgi:hypothetical protein